MSLAARERAGWFAVMTGDSTTTDYAPGRMDDGFLLVARDLFRAIVAARFSTAQHLLIQQGIEESYGKARLRKSAEPLPFRLNVSELARITGFARSYLAQQHAELVACGFLEAVDGLYLINKDYRRWTGSDGSPRLSESAVAWCLDGKTRRNGLSGIPDTLSGIPDTSAPVTEEETVRYTRHPVRYTRQDEPLKNLAPLSGIPDTPCQVYQTPSDAPPRTPHRGTRAGRFRDFKMF